MKIVIRYLEWRLKKPWDKWNDEDVSRAKRDGLQHGLFLGLSFAMLYFKVFK
jgi:hypothetical protein